MKNDTVTIIKLPKEIKKAFQKKCDDELIGMSVKIRQMILGYLKETKKINIKGN